MKFLGVITEIREKAIAHLKKLAPNWPEYVLRDFVDGNYKNYLDEAQEVLEKWSKKQGYRNIQEVEWKFEMLDLTVDSFDRGTVNIMKEHEFGKLNPPRPLRRLEEGQPNKKPIILIRHLDGKYELIEGLDRTMRSLILWPKGYQQTAYVAIKKS
jgi:hypothetical protein